MSSASSLPVGAVTSQRSAEADRRRRRRTSSPVKIIFGPSERFGTGGLPDHLGGSHEAGRRRRRRRRRREVTEAASSRREYGTVMALEPSA